MRILTTTLLLAFSFLQMHCASVNSVSLTSIPAERTREIRAEASRVIILGFNFNNDYVDQVVEDLKRQCKGGQVKGILTKDQTIDYFLFFVYKRQVTSQGYCVVEPEMKMSGTAHKGAAL
jgi:hypothetical protein